MSDRCLPDNVVRSDNSDRCIAVSIRRKEWPRTKTSCMAKTSRSSCSLPSPLSSANANSSWGSSKEWSAEISTRTPRGCGSFAQHSGDFVLIILCGLTAASQLQPDKVVGGSTAKTKKVAVQPIPKPDRPARSESGCKFHRQRTMAGACDVLAELGLVRRKNADAA